MHWGLRASVNKHLKLLSTLIELQEDICLLLRPMQRCLLLKKVAGIPALAKSLKFPGSHYPKVFHPAVCQESVFLHKSETG